MAKTKKEIKKEIDNNLQEEFTLNQSEVHDFGRLVLNRLMKRYDMLVEDPDHCWSLSSDLKLFKKLSFMVVRLQNGEKLKEEDKTST